MDAADASQLIVIIGVIGFLAAVIIYAKALALGERKPREESLRCGDVKILDNLMYMWDGRAWTQVVTKYEYDFTGVSAEEAKNFLRENCTWELHTRHT